MEDTQAVFDALKREREYQDRKWGTLAEHNHTINEWIGYIEGYVQRAKALNKEGYYVSALHELLCATALGVVTMEQHGIVERQQPTPQQEAHEQQASV